MIYSGRPWRSGRVWLNGEGIANMAKAKKYTNRQASQQPAEFDESMLMRPMPSSIEAEVAVLGSIFLLPDVLDNVIQILRADDFYDDANRLMFEAILDTQAEGKKVDPVIIREKLKAKSKYDAIGGAGYFAKVVTSVNNAAHAEYYAEIVRSKATLRKLIVASTDILSTAYEPDVVPKDALSQAEQQIFNILDNRSSSTLKSMKDILDAFVDRLDARLQGVRLEGFVESGFSRMDEMTGGFRENELLILAARPSMGKTAFAMNVAANVAIRQNQPTLFISLEMGSNELIDRLICSEARVNGHQLRNGSLSKAEQTKLSRTAGQIANAPFFVDDAPSRSVSEIAAAGRRVKRQCDNKLGLIVIDYLQLVEPDNPNDPRQEQVAKIARRLKGMARELKVPILCLAQLNRQAEDSRDHRPKLSHLRESGAIEQDADIVMFVHREEYYRKGDPEALAELKGQAVIIIEKQRNGPTGDVELVWQADFTRFEDKAPERFSEFDSYEPPPGDL
jgi:replicative DNA helicase